MRYFYLLFLFGLATSCSSDSQVIEVLLSSRQYEDTVDRHIVLVWPECRSCIQHLKDRVKANVLGRCHFTILTSSVRNARIEMGFDDLSHITFLDAGISSRVSDVLTDRIAILDGKDDVVFIPEIEFYSEVLDKPIVIDEKDSVCTIIDLPGELFDAKVKKFGSVYAALVTWIDESARTRKGIVWSSGGSSVSYFDKDDLSTNGGVYPLGLHDFTISGDTIFLVSSLEIVYLDLNKHEVIFRRMIDFPPKSCVNHWSSDFDVTHGSILVPVHHCFIGYHSRERYTSTSASHLILDRTTGVTLDEIGRVPQSHMHEHSLLRNGSAAVEIDGCFYIFYPFSDQNSIGYPGQCSDLIFIPGLQQLDISYLDHEVTSMIQDQGIISSETYRRFGNAYYGNIVSNGLGYSMELHPGIQTNDQYVFIRQASIQSHCEYYLGGRDDFDARWVENDELELLFSVVDDASIRILRGIVDDSSSPLR